MSKRLWPPDIYTYLSNFVEHFLFIIYVSEVGGSETNREIVSVRAHARTRGLVVRSELGKKKLGVPLFPFPFGRRRVSSREFL